MSGNSLTSVNGHGAPELDNLWEGELRLARNIRAGNFAWLAKPALLLIQGSFSESNNVASAFAVYLALAWLASDNADAPFQVSKGLIAYRAGVSIRTAGDVLKKLEAIGLVRVERQKAESGYPDAPNRYTLLAVGNGCLPVGNGCSPVGNGRFQPSLPTGINKGRTKVEEIEKKPSSPKAREVSFDTSTVEGIYQAYPRTPANEQERAQAGELARRVKAATQAGVKKAFADQGYTGEKPAADTAEHGVELEVVKLAEAKRGFVLLPRRWVVERSFGWLARFRRLSRDYERLPKTLAGLHWLAFSSLLLNNLFKTLALSS